MNAITPDKNNKGYAKGFEDGYDEGVYNNPWDGEMECVNHLQYKWGYDAGVADYCRDFLDSEEE